MGASQQSVIETTTRLPFASDAQALDQASLIALMGGTEVSVSPLEKMKGVKVPALDIENLPVSKRLDGDSVKRLGSLLKMMPEAIEVLKKSLEHGWLTENDLRGLMQNEDGLNAAETATDLLEKASSGLVDSMQVVSDQLIVDTEKRFREITNAVYRHNIQNWHLGDAADGIMPVVADRKLMDEVRFDGVGLAVVEPAMACIIDLDLSVLSRDLSPLSVLAYDLIEKLSFLGDVASLGNLFEMTVGHFVEISELIQDRKLVHFINRGVKKYWDDERWWRRVNKLVEKRCPNVMVDMLGEELEISSLISYAMDYILLECEQISFIEKGMLPKVNPGDAKQFSQWLEAVKEAAKTWEGSEALRKVIQIALAAIEDYGLVQMVNGLEPWGDYHSLRLALVDEQWFGTGVAEQFGEMIMGEEQETFSKIDLDNPIEPLAQRCASRLLLSHICIAI